MAGDLLSIYLRDHHAGAVGGVGLARRTAGANESSPYGRELASLAAEIEADQETLESLMAKLGITPDKLKDVAAFAGERVARLKLNGRWLSYSPLSRVLELEGLELSVASKRSLWRSLRHVAGDTVDGIDLPALEARAERQRERIEELRLRAVTEALEPVEARSSASTET